MNTVVPEPFQYPPFYEKGMVLPTLSASEYTMALKEVPFYFDIATMKGREEHKPWLDKKTSLPKVFFVWKEVKEELADYYHKRERKLARKQMIRMIALLIDGLFWLNNKPVTQLKDLEQEIATHPFAPVNANERLAFILKDPDHYHSFVQLVALFEESEKLFYKVMVLERK